MLCKLMSISENTVYQRSSHWEQTCTHVDEDLYNSETFIQVLTHVSQISNYRKVKKNRMKCNVEEVCSLGIEYPASFTINNDSALFFLQNMR